MRHKHLGQSFALHLLIWNQCTSTDGQMGLNASTASEIQYIGSLMNYCEPTVQSFLCVSLAPDEAWHFHFEEPEIGAISATFTTTPTSELLVV